MPSSGLSGKVWTAVASYTRGNKPMFELMVRVMTREDLLATESIILELESLLPALEKAKDDKSAQNEIISSVKNKLPKLKLSQCTGLIDQDRSEFKQYLQNIKTTKTEASADIETQLPGSCFDEPVLPSEASAVSFERPGLGLVSRTFDDTPAVSLEMQQRPGPGLVSQAFNAILCNLTELDNNYYNNHLSHWIFNNKNIKQEFITTAVNIIQAEQGLTAEQRASLYETCAKSKVATYASFWRTETCTMRFFQHVQRGEPEQAVYNNVSFKSIVSC